MGVSNSYLSRTEVQQLLGINSFGLWRLVRKYDDFPQPTEPPHDPPPQLCAAHA
jgi:predicted DNA-binding transcriptional regulator AlpA